MKLAIGDLLKPVVTGLPKLLPRMGHRHAFSIGLDLGPDALNLAQMEGTGENMCLRAIASLPYSCPRDELYRQPRELRALLKQAFATGSFKGKRVVSCLPAGEIKIITVSYKPVKGQSDATAIVAGLRERLPEELDDMVLDFMTLRHEDNESDNGEALVALAPRKKVMDYLELLTGAGLAVDALDVGPAALARLVRHAGARHWPAFPLAPNALLVNFGADSSFLTIVWGRRLILDRAVEFSENRMFSRLKQVLDLPAELAKDLLYEKEGVAATRDNGLDEARRTISEVLGPEISLLLHEINKTLAYMASKTRGKSVDVVYLSGRVARYPGILKSLKDQLQIPVTVLNPVALFATAECASRIDDDLGMMPGVALATGLALRGMSDNG
jgi:type IV pilus assembly protein PilM